MTAYINRLCNSKPVVMSFIQECKWSSIYLDNFPFDGAVCFGRRALHEGEEKSSAELVLHLHFKVRIHEELEALIIDILFGLQ